MNAYFRDRLILVSFAASALLNIILWGVLLGKFRYSAEPIPLHFSIVYGIDYVSSAHKIYQMPAVGALIIIVNAVLGKLLYKSEKLFTYFLNFASLFFQGILLIAAAALVVL